MANICEGILVMRNGDLKKIVDAMGKKTNVTEIDTIYKKVGIKEPPEDYRCSIELTKWQEDGSLILYTDSPWDSFISVWDRLAEAVGATYNGAFFNGEAYWIESQNEFAGKDFPERCIICIDSGLSFLQPKEAGEEILAKFPDRKVGLMEQGFNHLSDMVLFFSDKETAKEAKKTLDALFAEWRKEGRGSVKCRIDDVYADTELTQDDKEPREER